MNSKAPLKRRSNGAFFLILNLTIKLGEKNLSADLTHQCMTMNLYLVKKLGERVLLKCNDFRVLI